MIELAADFAPQHVAGPRMGTAGVTQRRGSGPLGFDEQVEQCVSIASFRALVETRRNRRDGWYFVPAGHVDVCNVPIIVRPRR